MVDARMVRFGDATIAYRVEGKGPAVLAIQGVGVHGAGWQPQVDALKRDFRVITCDNRGVGGSPLGQAGISIELMAADAAAVLDAEAVDRVHLIGHSMGGLIALQLALNQPQRVISLALLCTFLNGADAGRLSARMLLAGLRTRLGTRGMRREAMMRMVFPAAYLRRFDAGARTAFDQHVQALFGRDLADQPPIVATQLRALSRSSFIGRLAQLPAVTALVISGAHDPIAPPALGRALAAAIPAASFVEFDDAGHALPIQCADRVNDRLREHLVAAERRVASLR